MLNKQSRVSVQIAGILRAWSFCTSSTAANEHLSFNLISKLNLISMADVQITDIGM